VDNVSDDVENLNESETPPPASLPMPPAPQVVYIQQTPAPNNALATTALILGIVGVVLFWTFWFGIILGVLAIIFGAMGLSRAKSGAPNKGMATAGLVLGIVSVVLGALFIVAIFSLGNSAQDRFDRFGYCMDHPRDPTC
jgi:hypothetical protein